MLADKLATEAEGLHDVVMKFCAERSEEIHRPVLVELSVFLDNAEEMMEMVAAKGDFSNVFRMGEDVMDCRDSLIASIQQAMGAR